MYKSNESKTSNRGLLSREDEGGIRTKRWSNLTLLTVALVGLCLGVGMGALIWAGDDDDSDSLSSGSPSLGALSPFPSCNVGPMHHSHLIVPLAATEEECALDSSRFLLSHGATFFCPHTWDIKLLASIEEDAARETLCGSYFNAVENGLSPTHAFRPDLDQGGLPATALGQLTEWESPVIYWVYDFGNDPEGGPTNPSGVNWNLTTIYDQTTHVQLEHVLYSRQLELQPAPAALTYLVHAPQDGETIVLSHYISTGGDAGFDHIAIVNMTRTDGRPLSLRPTWALYLTLLGVTDSGATRLTTDGGPYIGVLSVYDNSTNLPTSLEVNVNVTLDYYYGFNDGFANFLTICPDNGNAASPTMCLNGASDSDGV
jgi:hypothetical protein